MCSMSRSERVLLLAGIARAFAMLVLIVLVAAVKPINFINVRRLELAMEFPFFAREVLWTGNYACARQNLRTCDFLNCERAI